MAVGWVGPYRILDRLGSGAMGKVYLADDPRLRRRVALKTLLDPGADRSEARHRILHEARAAARLNHPNVAAIHDVVEANGGVHIVMEYVPGETLAARLTHGPLPSPDVVAMGIQLAEALAEAHAMGVIHRDLKPGNVMVTPAQRVKVLDFGLARTRAVQGDSSGPPSDSTDRRSDDDHIVGTPPYISPEALLGGPVDARGDIYSLGVTLFEMLTGQRPFKGRDLATVRAAALTGPTPRARQLNPSVSAGLDAVVARAMARNPQERYGSAAEMVAALQHEREAGRDVPTASWYERRPASWHRRPRLVAGATALAVLLALWSFWPRPRAAAPPPNAAVVAVLPLSNMTGDARNDYIGIGIADVLISTLSQIPGVTMVSRGSTLAHRQPERDVAAIARELGADFIIDGALQAFKGTVRVTLSLLEPRSNRVAWSRSYDGALADVFALQKEAGAALSKAVRATLSASERSRLERPPTANVEALADYAQARSFLERSDPQDVKGNLERGITLFQSAIARDARFARAHAGLGEAYWQRYQETREREWAEKALWETTEALRLDPGDASVHYAVAVVYAGEDRIEQAAEELRRAIAIQPASDEAHVLLGRILFQQGRRDEGLAALARAVTLRPNYWRNHYALGIAYYDSGRFPEAAAAFRRVGQLQPDSARGPYMLGTVALATGDTAEAIALFQKAIAVEPESGSYTNLGHAFYGQGRYREAAAAFEEAARLAPRSPMKHRNLGDVYGRLGQPARARQAYRRAVELCSEALHTNPRDARMLAMRAVYQAKLGRWPEALGDADKAAAMSPQMADVIYRRAVVLALAGRADDSIAVLRQAIDAGSSRKLAGSDEDLAALRPRPDFQKLVTDVTTVVEKGGGR